MHHINEGSAGKLNKEKGAEHLYKRKISMLSNGHISNFRKSCLVSMMAVCMTPAIAMQQLSDDSLSNTTGEGVALILDDFKMVFQGPNDRSTASSYNRGILDPAKADTGFIRLIPTGENYQQISDRAFESVYDSAYKNQYQTSYNATYTNSKTSEFNRIQASERTTAYNEVNAAKRTEYTNYEKTFVAGTVAQVRYDWYMSNKYNGISYLLWSTDRKQTAAKADATNDVNNVASYITDINNIVTTKITAEANTIADARANSKADTFALAAVNTHTNQQIRTTVNAASNINNQKTKADVFIYGLALSKSDNNLNSRFSNLGFNWGSADNPWLIHAGTAKGVRQFKAGAKDVGYIAIEAPLMTNTPTESDNNIKLGFWTDIFARSFNSSNVVNPVTGGPISGLDTNERLRLQVVANGLSLNGSQVRLFQTLESPDINYSQTLGMTSLIRLNTNDRPDLVTKTSANLNAKGLRISTAARDNDSDGVGATPALNNSAAPIFNEFEGLYLYSPNINLVLGNMYQPFIVGSEGNNIILEVTRIPNVASIYEEIYQNYGTDLGGTTALKGNTCNVYQCGTPIKNNSTDITAAYQGRNATHSSITIGSVAYTPATNRLKAIETPNATGIQFKDANGVAKNFGSAVIDGVLIQHLKIKTTGL